MHIAPFDNKNKPIVDVNDSRVPLNFFNISRVNMIEKRKINKKKYSIYFSL